MKLFYVFLFTIIAAVNASEASAKTYVRKPTPKTAFLPPIPSSQSNQINIPYANKNFLIIIDPGHGGDDYGTHSKGLKSHEKYFNMMTSQYVKKNLMRMGYTVEMTRSNDTFISLEDRASFANTKKPSIFVSIHYNSAPNPTAEGIEIFYYQDGGNKNRTAKSKKLAQNILTHVIALTESKSRGVKEGNLSVIRETNMPAVLIECGFMTNINEMEKIKTTQFQENLAMGIAKGIQQYLTPHAR